MTRERTWKTIAILTTTTTALLSLLLLPACCCTRNRIKPGTPADIPPGPPLGNVVMPHFGEADPKGPTQAQMQNVDFRIHPLIILDIHTLRGEMVSKEAGSPINFDNKNSFILKVDRGRIGMKTASLDNLLNRFVFAYPGAPLKALHVSTDGKQLKQEGIIHKIIDIPFTMWADVSASDGKIRIHPTKIDICGLNGLGLLKAVGQNLEKMIGKQLPAEKGVTADKNDLLMEPDKLLPPPQTELHLVDVKIEGDEMVQVFDAGRHLPDLQPPDPSAKNWMFYQGGTLRMGKLLMIDADMQVNDTDPSDPFDFYIDRYNEELVEGFSRNQPDYGLVVYMRDFADVGTPPRPGETLVK